MDHDHLTFLGHSTVLIEVDGVRLLTDPLLGHVAGGAIRRQVPAVAADTLVGLAAVFISHGHLDHLDLASLAALPGEPALIVPAGLGRIVARARPGSVVHELRAGGRLEIDGLAVEAVEAHHGRRRSPLTAAEGALGLLVSGSRRIYFAGDTDLFPAMGRLRGQVDVALLPVGGWGPTLGRGHLDATRAADAAVRIGPAVALPIHWGTLYPLGLRRAMRARFDEPGEAFRRAVAARTSTIDVRVLRPGESMSLADLGGAR